MQIDNLHEAQSLFSGKNKRKNIFSLSFAEFAKIMVNVNENFMSK